MIRTQISVAFSNSGEEVNEIEIKDIILEYCNNETDSI